MRELAIHAALQCRAREGQIVEPLDPEAREIVAKFRDPAGNVMGVYQERSLS